METAEVAAEPEPPAEPVRVHEMAKALDIKSREILDAVAERLPELELKGAMSWIPAEHVATVRGFVAPEPEPTPEPEFADEATDVNGVTDDANATGDMADDGDDAPKKKRRRRRRRGGRKHRRDEDGEVDGERPGDADSTDESDDDEED